MSKYWLPTQSGREIKVTQAQWATAINWMDRTFNHPLQPYRIRDLFPERDNWANGQRRCCRRLAETGVLLDIDGTGYILPSPTRQHLDRHRYH